MRKRRPKISSAAFISRGSLSQAGNTSGVIPAKLATSSRKSSTSPTCASATTSVAGACSPSAVAISAEAEPHAPSIVSALPTPKRCDHLDKPRSALDDPRQVLQIGTYGPRAGR